jgi:radical SAM-linked protein
MARTPEGPPPPPVVQRLRIRWAKRGRLRFTSHRDFQRAFERALRRADVPMAYSAGFSPHPKISDAGAAPTGTASEAEYVEVGLAERVDPDVVRLALDAALSPGLDVLEVVEAAPGALADRLQASHWRIELPGVTVETAAAAVEAFLRSSEVLVERLTKDGVRTFDARGAVVRMGTVLAQVETSVGAATSRAESPLVPCAILDVVVRHGIPTVRPDDVLSGLRRAADLVPPEPPRAVRLAQGPLDEATGSVGDPLAHDRDGVGAPGTTGNA